MKISLNGQDIIETLNNITNIIGSYNDFCVSSLCLQSNTKGTATDRARYVTIATIILLMIIC